MRALSIHPLGASVGLSLVIGITFTPSLASEPTKVQAVISSASATLRLSEKSGGKWRHRVFPVGVGRYTPSGEKGPRGRFRTGRDARDRVYYEPARREPAFFRGLPFIRIDLPRMGKKGAVERPYGIHGPVTPSLIWGQVSAGCVRMRPMDLRLLYRVAQRHAPLAISFIGPRDRVAERELQSLLRGNCPSGWGVRRLKRLPWGVAVHDRVCPGVDHWYAVPLQGGDHLVSSLNHSGGLRVELYGIRAISRIASGSFGLEHRVPVVQANRGARYLRVVSATSGAPTSYTLRVQR